MTKTGHNVTGAILGIGFFSFAQTILHLPYLESVLAAYLCYKGANAPDVLEISSYDKKTGFRKSVIQHRTYTHWFLGWLILFVSGIIGYFIYSHYIVCLIGFALGGLLHLFMDLPNMSGIPIWHPRRKRKCWKLWKSGEHEGKICILLALLVLAYLYAVDFNPFKSWYTELASHKHELWHYFSLQLKELSREITALLPR